MTARHLRPICTAAVAVAVLTASSLGSPVSAQPTAPAGRWPELAVGVSVHALWDFYDLEDDPTLLRRVLRKMRDGGIQWVNIDFRWAEIERDHNDHEEDGYAGAFRRAVRMARDFGMKVSVTIDCTPAWVFGRDPHEGDNYDIACSLPPPDPAVLADFLSDFVVNRADGDDFFLRNIHDWELWNEADLKETSGFEEGDGFTPAKYAGLVRSAYRVLHPAGEIVVAGGFVSMKALIAPDGRPVVGNERAWLNNVFDPNGDRRADDGIKGYFDALSTHPYMGPIDAPPEMADPDFDGDGRGDYMWAISHTPVVRELMRYWGEDDKPLWFTEVGWSNHRNDGGEPGNWLCGVTLQQQADYAVRAFEFIQQWPYVTHVFWYQEIDMPHGHATNQWEERQWSNLGLLFDDAALTPKPVYHAVAGWLADRRPAVSDRPADRANAGPVDGATAARAGPGARPATHLELRISDASPVHRDEACRRYAVFQVSLNREHDERVTVRYRTADRTAEGTPYGVPPGDYEESQGTLRFEPGQTRRTIRVAVLFGEHCEPDCGKERFVVRLFDATQTIVDGVGVGEILLPAA